MSRKGRSDSSTAAVNNISMALKGVIDPPEHVKLRPGDRLFWDSIILSRAAVKWDNADLEIAGNLARCKADIERISEELLCEGDTLTNERGTVVMNPKHTLLEVLSRRSIALSRMLHVHPEAKQGESRHQGKANKADKEAREIVDGMDDELLGARH